MISAGGIGFETAGKQAGNMRPGPAFLVMCFEGDARPVQSRPPDELSPRINVAVSPRTC